MFNDQHNEEFQSAQSNISAVRELANSPATKRVVIRFANGDKKYETDADLLLAYRYNYKRSDGPFDSEQCTSKMFMNDCALFPFPSSIADELQKELYSCNLLQAEELKPINSVAELKKYHENRTPIVIREYEGLLYHRAEIDKLVKEFKGLCLSFCLESKDTDGNSQ